MTKTADHDEKFDGRPFAVNLDCIVLACSVWVDRK